MAKINKVYPAFFNGVSQQSPELVLDNQCKEMVNCIPSIVQGITKRPPVNYVTHRDFATYPEMEDASVFHVYDRGEDDEEYIMVNVDNADNPVQIFNKAGEPQEVVYNAEHEVAIKNYLVKGQLKGLTVQDRTWVFSKNAVVGTDTSETYPLQPDYTRVAYFWLKRGSGDRYNPFNYAVYLNNITYAVDPNKPDNSTSDPATGAEDSDVAAQLLADKINASVAVAYAGEISLSQSLAYKEFSIYIGAGKTGVTGTFPVTVDVSTEYYDSDTGYFSFFARVASYDPFGSTLVEEFTINEANAAGFTAEVRGSILKIYKDDGADFTFSSWDSWGNQASEGWKGEVNKISDLPKDMPFHDVYVKVLGDEGNTFTDYFVHWSGSSWVETLDPAANRGKLVNMPVKLDRSYIATTDVDPAQFVDSDNTYPFSSTWATLRKNVNSPYEYYNIESEWDEIKRLLISQDYRLTIERISDGSRFDIPWSDIVAYPNLYKVLIRSGYAGAAAPKTTADLPLEAITLSATRSTFVFNLVDWSQPIVGNDDNNPDPSFVGRKIQDLFFYKNRLGIASEDSVTLTETANYTNFFATTVVDIVDTDVIDITISTNQASKIYYAKPFNNSLYIFTKYAQYELVAEGVFSPSTVSISNTTNYPMATDVEPLVVNDSLYFVSTTNNQQQLREYIKTDNLNVKGIDLNVSTPTYLSKPIKKLIADGVLGYVLCCTDSGTVYLYAFKEDGTQRIQSSWSRWELYSDTVNHSNYEYFNIGSTVLVMYKEFVAGNYVYSNLVLDNPNVTTYQDTSSNGDLHTYSSSILLPDYYPKLSDIRTPLNKMLIKRVKVEGEGAFSGSVYRKDYNKTYTKSKDFSMKDMDLNVASKVGNVDITIYDDTTDNFKITSVVVEGLFNTTSREMR